jgi:hypothetical protein
VLHIISFKSQGCGGPFLKYGNEYTDRILEAPGGMMACIIQLPANLPRETHGLLEVVYSHPANLPRETHGLLEVVSHHS